MHQNALVSIIIPVFNAENYIKNTIDSVLAQTYKKIEIVVVDDGSTDSTFSIVRSLYDSLTNIRCFSLKKNKGTPATPRNFGVSKSKGEFIAFLDADDIWHPKKLELQLLFLKKYSLQVSSTNCIDFNCDKNLSFDKVIFPIPYSKITLFDQMLKYQTPTSSLLMHHSVAKKFTFPEDFFLKGREDLVQSLNMHSVIKKSIKLNINLVFYRNHPSQISKNKIIGVLKVIYILATHKNSVPNPYKLLLPLFVFSNIFLSFYYRFLRNKL